MKIQLSVSIMSPCNLTLLQNERTFTPVVYLLVYLRRLATDGLFVPVPASAEVLLVGSHDLLQSAHIRPVNTMEIETASVGRADKRRQYKTR